MAITAWDDISSLVESWVADDATVTSGTDVDDIVGGEGTYNVDDPGTYESTPNYNSTGAPAGDAIVEFDTTRARLQCDTDLNITGDYTVVYSYAAHDDASEYILWHAGGFELLTVNVRDTGADHVHNVNCGFSQELDGPAVVSDEWITLIIVKDTTGGSVTAYWDSRSTSDTSATTSENILQHTIGNYTGGSANGQSSMKCFAIYDKACSTSEIDDLFDYTDGLINGSSGQTLTASLADFSPTFPAASVRLSLDAGVASFAPAFLAASLQQSLTAGVASFAPSFPAASVQLSLEAGVADFAPSFPAMTLVSGQSLDVPLISFAPSFPAASVQQSLAAATADLSPTFPSASVQQTLTAVAAADLSPAFPAASFQLQLTATRADLSPAFPAASVQLSLDAGLADFAPSFPTASVTRSLVFAAAASFAATFPSASVQQSLTATLADFAPTFPAASVINGALNVSGSLTLAVSADSLRLRVADGSLTLAVTSDTLTLSVS